MNRATGLRALQETAQWDVAIIGGGATGLGCALDAALRGYRTVLLEQGDFAQATSSRSTKLVHGGVRYLRQGNLPLVRSALRERGHLLRNAPHLVHPLGFVIPAYSLWEKPYYAVGLKLYDSLAGALGIAPSRTLSREETLELIPGVAPKGLRGGVLYQDAQFDDARLAIALAQSFAKIGGVPLNYVRVCGLLKSQDKLCGVSAYDIESDTEFEVHARVVINATGVFSDAVRELDERACRPMLTRSQGAHIVLDARFLPGNTALMIPRTEDGRVLFAIPWQGRVLVGTTDTPVDNAPLEPRAQPQEIAFLLSHAARYLAQAPAESDILSVFAGLRPLIKTGADSPTAGLSRDHVVSVSASGLVSIGGGKWTTYRKMAEDAVTAAAQIGRLPTRASETASYALEQSPILSAAPNEEEVRQAVRHEMARSLEDMLARRSRALFLDARASLNCAPQVAQWMAAELGRAPDWPATQVTAFKALAAGYLPIESSATPGSP